ncbi:MAG: [protein-PII] uridylyltransferase [Ilumatobacteraceae bacterium]
MPDTPVVGSEREVVINDRQLGGRELCTALAATTDRWLAGIFAQAVADHRPRGSAALLAVGGYGRGELAPWSDLDVLLLFEGRTSPDEFAAALWYPLWDAGLKVGHAVRTPKQTLQLLDDELDVATALLDGRVVAGDTEFGTSLVERARTKMKRDERRWLRRIHERVTNRHKRVGEVAFVLEPDVKEGRGGLRDVHALGWAARLGMRLPSDDEVALRDAYDTLLSVRVAVHRAVQRPVDVLRLQDQDVVADLAGYGDADDLMAALAAAARRITWIADESWAQLDPPRNSSPVPQRIAPGVDVRHGEVHLADDADPAGDPTLVLRLATAAARRRLRIDRGSLERLADLMPTWPDPWPAGASDDLVALLCEEHAAIPVIESLDHYDLWSRIIPEWTPVRSRPQRNAFHRFTVDRHLWEVVANAAQLRHRVGRADLLVLGALFHDLGKGYPGDHTEAGMELFDRIGPRMGLNPDDVEVVRTLIEHHLLLPDVATRRDLSDAATIQLVADAVRTGDVLELLHTLTIADATGTGPTAWGPWKEDLVATLVERTRELLSGHEPDGARWQLFPDEATLLMMARGDLQFHATGDTVTVTGDDQPGVFSTVAGVLAMRGLDVLAAEAHSDAQGRFANRFHVRDDMQVDWEQIERDVRGALDGRVSVVERLRERASTYRPTPRRSAAAPIDVLVRLDDSASSDSTMIEVHARDKVGLLFELTRAIAELGLDLRHARIHTMHDEVVDTFYVRTSEGGKVVDPDLRHRLEATLSAVVAS